MEFAWTAEQEAYRDRIRRLVRESLPDDWWENYASEGPSAPAVMEFARGFGRKLAATGDVASHWPAEHGGRESSAWEHIILSEEMWSEAEPRSSLYMGSNWVGPAVMAFGTPEQKAEHLGKISRGEVLWCQGFSEPESGSDLVSLRMHAERVEDGYVLNGRKIWTSYAHSADWIFVLARVSGRKHDGITCFLVPLDTSGLTVRTIKALHMADDFHETTFDNVHVPFAAMLGEEGRGWDVVTTLMHHERVGQAHHELAARGLALAVEMLMERAAFPDVVQAQAAVCQAEIDAARVLCYKVIDERVKRTPPNAITSMARVAMIRSLHSVANFIADNLPGELSDRGHGRLRWVFKFAAAVGIAAGATEIQLNLIGERHLGMPRGA